jgi:hypothetical protein
LRWRSSLRSPRSVAAVKVKSGVLACAAKAPMPACPACLRKWRLGRGAELEMLMVRHASSVRRVQLRMTSYAVGTTMGKAAQFTARKSITTLECTASRVHRMTSIWKRWSASSNSGGPTCAGPLTSGDRGRTKGCAPSCGRPNSSGRVHSAPELLLADARTGALGAAVSRRPGCTTADRGHDALSAGPLAAARLTSLRRAEERSFGRRL